VPARVFAPGAIKLFGEHAVVYGKPAIAAAIDRGVRVECSAWDRLAIETAGTPARLVYIPDEGRLEARGAERFLAYAVAAIKVAREAWGDIKARFTIESELPPGIGAATSAAVSVGILRAYAACAGAGVSKEELARLGHRVELEVQGIASPMDTAVVTFGGLLRVWPSPLRVERLSAALPPLYVVVLPRRGTTGEIVADVKSLLARHKSAASVVDAIGALVDEAHGCLVRGDLECVGELMELNNWLLGALKVVDSRVVSLLELTRPFTYGGKVSGAGRGGVVVLLPRDGRALDRVLSALGYAYYRVSVAEGGVTARSD
jgi:mevalonate kinase